MAADPYAEFNTAPTAATPTADPYAEFTSASSPAPDAPPETVGRVAGLTGRSLMQGVADIEDAPRHIGHAVDGAAVWLLKRAGVVSPDYQLPDPDQAVEQIRQQHPTLAAIAAHVPTLGTSNPFAPSASEGAQTLADKAGLPTAATPGERVYSKAVEAAPSAVFAPEAPVAGALWSAAGGAASQTTAEAGGGPVAQTLAGLAAGGLPVIGAGAAGLARTATRGAGEAAAQTVQQRIANAADTGVNLTAGQATGSRLLQTAESASGRLWGGGPIKAAAENQTAALDSHVNNIVDNLSQGATPSPTAAGEAINTGVAAAKQSMKQAEKAAYDKVDSLVPANSQVDVSGTLGKLRSLSTPTAGAEATTGALTSPAIADLHANLTADAAKAGGTLPYSSVRAVRTAVGNKIDWGFSPSDPVTNGQLKQVYGALGADLDAHASAISPQAQSAVSDAGALYKANQGKRDLLNGIVDKAGGPEAVYQAATNGTKLGATKISGVMSAIGPDQQNLVRATVLDRLGRAIPSQQNAASNAFSADTFLTNWAKMSDEAKTALFGSRGSAGSLRASLDSLEDTASTIREGTAHKNPSGTSGAMGHGMGLWAFLSEAAGAAMGHGVAPIATLAGGTVANMGLSRALVNPRTARWLAQTTKLPKSAVPNAVNQLAKMGQATNDPGARDLAATLQPAPVPVAGNVPQTVGDVVRDSAGDHYQYQGGDKKNKASYRKM